MAWLTWLNQANIPYPGLITLDAMSCPIFLRWMNITSFTAWSNLDLDHTLWSQLNRRTFLDCHLLFLRLGNFFGTRCTELKTDLTRFLNSLYQSLGGSVTTHVCPGWAPPYNWVLWAGPALSLSRCTAASLPCCSLQMIHSVAYTLRVSWQPLQL